MKQSIDTSDRLNCACFNLRKAARVVTQMYDAILRPVGLKATQFTILSLLADNESIPITQLANELVMDRTTLTRNLGPLVKQGLIMIATGQDQRVRVVSLTNRGHVKFADALPLWQYAQNRMKNELGPQRLKKLLSELAETRQIAKKAKIF